MKSELILYTSYCKQITHKGVKADWILFDKNDKEIHRFPKDYTEKKIFEILDFAKKFELDAFNKGVIFQKKMQPHNVNALNSVVRQLKNENETLLTENERIGGELDKLITYKED
jgi:hypothetical protein